MSTDDKQELTIKEFKMWLRGVEEMQDDSWCPSPTQWKKIRAKIDEITEQSNSFQQPTPIGEPLYPTTQRYVGEYNGMPPAVPSNFGTPVPGLASSPMGSFQPSQIPPPSRPAAPASFPTSDNPSVPVHTPNIDTTNGTYESSFQ